MANYITTWTEFGSVHRVVIPQIQDLTRLPHFPDAVNCIPHVKRQGNGFATHGKKSVGTNSL